jgi:hypothetical protein
MRRRFILFSAACALLLTACGGSDDAESGNALAERWLRLGEEPQTSVAVYDGALPPNLVQLLNQDADDETPEEDLVSFPVHPDGDLLGSYVMRTPDGASLIWLIYDVPLDEREIEATVAQQLDESPWQATSMQANPSLSVVQFQSTISGDVEGSVIVQAQPSVRAFEITVSRDDSERTLEFTRGAYIPVIEAGIDDDLAVNRVDPGMARLAGLEDGDRIVAVGETAVSNREELVAALQGLAQDGERSTGLTYIIQVQPVAAPDEAPFVLPPSRELPDRFPSREVWEGLTVVEYRWVSVAEGRAYEAGMLAMESTSATAANMRQALETAGWEIIDDRPSGFATILDVAHTNDGLVGSVQIDAFQENQDYTLVVVQIQTAQ